MTVPVVNVAEVSAEGVDVNSWLAENELAAKINSAYDLWHPHNLLAFSSFLSARFLFAMTADQDERFREIAHLWTDKACSVDQDSDLFWVPEWARIGYVNTRLIGEVFMNVSTTSIALHKYVKPDAKAFAFLAFSDVKTKLMPYPMRVAMQKDGSIEAHKKYSVPLGGDKLRNGFLISLEEKIHNQATNLPICGEFSMGRSGTRLLSSMGAKEVRLSITPVGMWVGVLFGDTYCLDWYSCRDGVRLDTFDNSYGMHHSMTMNVFSAALWLDLITVERKPLLVRRNKRLERHQKSVSRQTKRTIHLPRVLRTLEWQDGDFSAQFKKGFEGGNYSVRAHYRELPEGFKASQDAIDNALASGFPEPPSGYTFVSPYDVGGGEPGDMPPPRIVAKGLQAAMVALAIE